MSLNLNEPTPILQTIRETPGIERRSRSRCERRTEILHDNTTQTANNIRFQNPLCSKFKFSFIDMNIFEE